MLPDGRMSPEWWSFFLALFNRTGGAGSPIDINSLQKQDEISQDVPPQNAATMLALQGVNDLWSEQRAFDNTSEIHARLSELASALNLNVDVQSLLQKLNDLESMMADYRAPSPAIIEQWNTPTLLNSWVAYGSPYNPPGYWKDQNSVVHLRGQLRSGTMGAAIFNLPLGYRPFAQETIPIVSNGAFGNVNITTSGDVQASAGSNAAFSLDGITFRAV